MNEYKVLTSVLWHLIIEFKQVHLRKIKWFCIKGDKINSYEMAS
jgi:hypothetical protein